MPPQEFITILQDIESIKLSMQQPRRAHREQRNIYASRMRGTCGLLFGIVWTGQRLAPVLQTTLVQSQIDCLKSACGVRTHLRAIGQGAALPRRRHSECASLSNVRKQIN